MAFPRDAPHFEESFTLRPQGEAEAIAELSVELEAGQSLTYRWEAEAEVEFNIHSHRDEDVTYHERLLQREADGLFKSRSTGDYYLMWQNPHGRPVPVRVALRR